MRINREEKKEVQEAKTQYSSPYVISLRGTIGYYLPWIPESAHDVETYYEILETDAAIKHALNLMALMSAGEYFQIKSNDVRLNKIMMKALLCIKRFTHARKSMVEKSMLYGLSVQRKYWKKIVWPEFPGMVWEVPVKLKEVDKRRLRIERSMQDRTNLRWTMWSLKEDKYVVLEDKAIVQNASISMQDFIWVWYTEEESSPYYQGLGEVLYTLGYIKSKVLQYWADLAEQFGRPILIATIDAARSAVNLAGSAGISMNDYGAIVNNWLDILENMRARNVAVKPDHDKLEVHEAGSIGNNILQQLLEYVDSKIQLLILGAELTTIAPSVGSYALGQIHRGATNSVVMYNRSSVDEEITRDLLYEIYLRNRQNFYSLGIRWPGFGSIQFSSMSRPDEASPGDIGGFQMDMGEFPADMRGQ